MARGKSGRIVLEVDPNIKRRLYLALEQNQITLKDWFLKTANSFLKANQDIQFINHTLVAEETSEYNTKPEK